jgi:hypothetical protein
MADSRAFIQRSPGCRSSWSNQTSKPLRRRISANCFADCVSTPAWLRKMHPCLGVVAALGSIVLGAYAELMLTARIDVHAAGQPMVKRQAVCNCDHLQNKGWNETGRLAFGDWSIARILQRRSASKLTSAGRHSTRPLAPRIYKRTTERPERSHHARRVPAVTGRSPRSNLQRSPYFRDRLNDRRCVNGGRHGQAPEAKAPKRCRPFRVARSRALFKVVSRASATTGPPADPIERRIAVPI